MKQSAQPSNSAAATTAGEAVPPVHTEAIPAALSPGDSFKGAEKRRSARYKCEGSAEVREEGCDVRTWATFNDVSVHGCFVEAQATYPAGTVLHMKLEVIGIRVETQGTVRVSYPYLGMGVAFTEMTEENTVQRAGNGLFSMPASAPLSDVPLVNDAAAAVQALVEFFENRQMLMREDFLRVLKKSQK